MNLSQAIQLYGTAGGVSGQKWYVVDKGYGHVISEHESEEEAKKASLARPYSKVLSNPEQIDTPEIRDIARKRMVRHNPDVD
jgi:hypothetical protein